MEIKPYFSLFKIDLMLKMASKYLSLLFYPFVSLSFFYLYAVPLSEALFFGLMVGLPTLFWLIYNVKKGHYTDADVSDRQRRKSLYWFLIGNFMAYQLAFMLVFKHHDDKTLAFLLALVVLFLSNFYVKSSMHTVLNLVIAALFWVAHFQKMAIFWGLMALLVGISRVILKKHSKLEVFMGILIGGLVSILYICKNLNF